MNNILRLLILTVFLVVQPALAGLPPTRSGGQSDTLSTTFDFKAPYSQITKYSSTGGLIETGSYQLLKNPAFEATTYSSNWTASGGTLAAATSTNIFFGKSATWDSGASSQTLTTTAVTVPEGFKGNNCEASLYIKVPSGTATHLIQAWDGTNILATASIINSIYFAKNTLTFPCPTSGTIALRLISLASDEPLIAIDEGYLGLARNVGVADYIGRVESYTPSLLTSGGGSITLNATSQVAINGKKQRIGSNLFISASFRNGSGGAASGSAGTMLITIPSECVPDTSQMITSVAGVRKLGDSISGTTGAGTEGTAFYYGGQNLAFLSNGVTNALVVADVASSFFLNFNAIIPCVGWAASQVVTPDAQGWFVSGYISGANPDLGTSSVSTYSEITNSSLTLTPDTGSAPIGIVCSSTNAAATPSTGATTCSAGSEGIGFATSVPRAGRYEVCMQFGHATASSATDAGMATAFEIVNTATNSQTILNRMGPRSTSGHYNNPATSMSKFTNVTACGQATLSAGSNAFRLFYEQSSLGANAVSSNVIHADANASIGDRAVRVTMRPVTTENQAILANSVSTKYQTGVTEETAIVTCSSSSGIDRQLGTWVSSVGNISSGVCSVTVNGFGGTPYCDINGWGTGISNVIVRAYCSSSTACEVSGYNTATGLAATAFTAKFSCKAQR